MGDRDVGGVERGDIIKFLHTMGERTDAPNSPIPRPAKRRSAKTIRNYHTALSALWSWAVLEGYALEHVVQQVKPPKSEPKPIMPFTQDEIIRMVRACRKTRAWHNRPLTESERFTAQRDEAIILVLAEMLDSFFIS
jgi:integrase